MGLRELNSIDIIVERPPFETEKCKLILLVIDATADLSPGERFDLLTKKLAGYLGFVASPDLPNRYPGLKPSDVIARVLSVIPATDEMKQITQVATADKRFRLRVFFEDYHAYMAKIRGGKAKPPSAN